MLKPPRKGTQSMGITAEANASMGSCANAKQPRLPPVVATALTLGAKLCGGSPRLTIGTAALVGRFPGPTRAMGQTC